MSLSFNRREFLAAASAGLLRAQSPAPRPNIVFILADDLGYGDLSCYGQQQFSSPNIDQLAKEGVRFTDAYAGDTVCAPSRCALMTGLHSGHGRIRGNANVPLQPGDITVAKLLKSAGYRTGLVGKWGLGGAGSPGIPNLQGFDDFYGYLDQRHAHTYFPDHLWRNQEEEIQGGNLGTRKEWSHDKFTAHALEFLEQNKANPFFLYLAYTVPHANNELGRDTGNGMEIPSDEPFHGKDWPQVEKNFAAMVNRLDRDVGKVMAKLRALGLDEKTLVIFTSDNGAHREGGHDPEFFQSRGGLRGIKRDMYEGGIRVPMIARWTGRIQPGSTTDQVCTFWDFLPTAADLAGVATPKGIDGISIVDPILHGQTVPHPPLYWEFHEGGFKRAARIGTWKGVKLGSKVPLELYDLKSDRAEKNNVATAHPDVVKQIETFLASARTDSKEFPIRERAPDQSRKKA